VKKFQDRGTGYQFFVDRLIDRRLMAGKYGEGPKVFRVAAELPAKKVLEFRIAP